MYDGCKSPDAEVDGRAQHIQGAQDHAFVLDAARSGRSAATA